jgi:hypothetical protein
VDGFWMYRYIRTNVVSSSMLWPLGIQAIRILGLPCVHEILSGYHSTDSLISNQGMGQLLLLRVQWLQVDDYPPSMY